MNLRCIYCQTPFTLSRAEMVAAIQHMTEKNMNHYDAHCPRCRRANSISRQRMELFFPNWQEAAKQAASVAEREPASASMKTVPLPKGAKAAAKITPAKKPAAKKPAAKPAAKPAVKKATAKPAAKKAPAKGKKK
jgi:phage FluMu protein Com